MSTVKCKNCKKEISLTAKYCPNCGQSNQKQFCKKCGSEMKVTDTVCSSCGYTLNGQISYSGKQSVQTNQGDSYELALIGLICSFIVPIAGLVLGIIVINSNKGLKNDARTLGLVAVVVSALELLFVVGVLFLYFAIFFMAYS